MEIQHNLIKKKGEKIGLIGNCNGKPTVLYCMMREKKEKHNLTFQKQTDIIVLS